MRFGGRRVEGAPETDGNVHSLGTLLIIAPGGTHSRSSKRIVANICGICGIPKRALRVASYLLKLVVVPGPRVCGFKAATACAAPVTPRSLRQKRQSGQVPLAAVAAAKGEARQPEARQPEAERADVVEVT